MDGQYNLCNLQHEESIYVCIRKEGEKMGLWEQLFEEA